MNESCLRYRKVVRKRMEVQNNMRIMKKERENYLEICSSIHYCTDAACPVLAFNPEIDEAIQATLPERLQPIRGGEMVSRCGVSRVVTEDLWKFLCA